MGGLPARSKGAAWNAADLRGKVEVLLAQVGVVAEPAARIELAEDITARAIAHCTRLLTSPDVPEHVRSLTSARVLDVEADLLARLARRAAEPAGRARVTGRGLARVDPTQAAVVGVLAGDGPLVVVEGAAGAGKTTALRAIQNLLTQRGHRLMVVTPTLKAADVAAAETGAEGHSAAWLIHQHGWRWDTDGHWIRQPDPTPAPSAQLRAGDLLLIDEAGMLDQDTARALLVIADEAGARIGFVGDRHQLPAVGRGGVLDHAVAWAHPTAVLRLERVHRFTDPSHAQLSLRMRTGDDPGAVFDQLAARGQIVIHASEVERTAALAKIGDTGSATGSTTRDLVIADTRDQVAHLNAAIREQRQSLGPNGKTVATGSTVTTGRGEVIALGDRVATRRNDPGLGVANRQTWTVADISDDGSLTLNRHAPGHSRGGGHKPVRTVPADYAARFVELAYATTVHGAQVESVDRAHVLIG